MSRTEDAWSISIKAIGGAAKKNSAGADNNNDVEKNFTVTVSPEDDLTSLYNQIEDITGLTASQQRLIYRGRLIGGLGNEESKDKLDGADPEPKIRDIAGLGDGQTIHLVRRKESRETTDAEAENVTTDNTTASPSSSSERDSDSLSGNGTASLLAALIGLGGLEGGENSEPAATATAAGAGQRQRIGWRSSRLGRNRRPHYRLTHEDLEIPDPGTMEPVRQGLMTLHTLLPHARVSPVREESAPSPLESNRRWYVGQWIDCRDTVNQWLEATIVEIIRPDDILPSRSEVTCNAELAPLTEPASDPAVSANDLDGRRQLLLEPCEEGDKDDEGGQLAGFKRRTSNKHVQLLLIHYNGWPHRWDEWIRSDSERIRPFRTRTRHPSMSTHASPTTQSAFNEAPSTVIRDDDVAVERTALLPEINRVVTAVNELIISAGTERASNSDVNQTNSENLETPWDSYKTPETPEDDLEDLPPLTEAVTEQCSGSSADTCPGQRRRQLELLAPVLDRLGRVLIDAAPHVATLATSLTNSEENDVTAVSVSQDQVDDNPSTLGGLLSLLGRDRRRQSSNAVASEVVPSSTETQEHSSRIDPDYVDFATGVVNTSRGEVRTGPRSRGGQSDDVAGLLGAYLAAASLGSISGGEGAESGEENGNNMMGLGRLLRERGTTGGGGTGIDIHIHAVVTAPGVAPGGGLGFATLGVPPTNNPATRNVLSPTRERRGSGSILRLRTPSVAEDEDDLGLFSELYSENPPPVNPNTSQDSDSDNATGDDDAARSEYSAQSDGEFLARLSSSRQGSGISAHTDSFSVSPSRSSSDGSSRRSTSSTSPRRNSVLGRFFRRSRRSNN